MTNEEFQKIILEEIRALRGEVVELKQGQTRLEQRQTKLEEGQTRLEQRQTKLEEGQTRLEQRQTKLEEGQTRLEQRQIKLEEGQKHLEIGQEEIKKDLKAVIEQTVGLTEFRQEANEKLDILIEENDIIKEINGRHEVDIRRLKRRII